MNGGEVDWEDGGVEGTSAHLVLQIQLGNTHICVSNTENDLKTDRTDSTNKGREETT